jgi:hypothetical protein
MVCPRCGKDAENSAAFCMRCGEKLVGAGGAGAGPRYSKLAIIAFLLTLGGLAFLAERAITLWFVVPARLLAEGALSSTGPACLVALACLIVSIVAMKRIGQSRGRLKGNWLCWGGLVLWIVALMLPLVGPPHGIGGLSVQCLWSVKNLATAVGMYVAEWERYPTAATWCDDIWPSLDQSYGLDADRLLCPATYPYGLRWFHDERERMEMLKMHRWPGSYAYNASLDRFPEENVAQPDVVVSIFESDAGWNAAGGPELLPKEPRHSGGDNYGFADGRATFRRRETALDPEKGVRWGVEGK